MALVPFGLLGLCFDSVFFLSRLLCKFFFVFRFRLLGNSINIERFSGCGFASIGIRC